MIGVGFPKTRSLSGKFLYDIRVLAAMKRSINYAFTRTNIKELALSDPFAWPQAPRRTSRRLLEYTTLEVKNCSRRR